MTLQQQNDMMRAALEFYASYDSTIQLWAKEALAACPPLPAPGEDEPKAWVTPLRYGSQVTFYKPPKPEGWDDDEQKWFCRPLYAALPAKPEKDEREAIFAAYSECIASGGAMTPNEIADKLLAAKPASAPPVAGETENITDTVEYVTLKEALVNAGEHSSRTGHTSDVKAFNAADDALAAFIDAHCAKLVAAAIEPYDDMLRELCSFLAVGGYNSEGFMPPSLADRKIRDGISEIVKVERERATADYRAKLLSLAARAEPQGAEKGGVRWI